MKGKLHIAKTQKEYKTGLKDPSKDMMLFPYANNMTMKGMKTPIKYIGLDENFRPVTSGKAYPGQKFNSKAVHTLEIRDKMQSGGRMKFQNSGNTPPNWAQQYSEALDALLQLETALKQTNDPAIKQQITEQFLQDNSLTMMEEIMGDDAIRLINQAIGNDPQLIDQFNQAFEQTTVPEVDPSTVEELPTPQGADLTAPPSEQDLEWLRQVQEYNRQGYMPQRPELEGMNFPNSLYTQMKARELAEERELASDPEQRYAARQLMGDPNVNLSQRTEDMYFPNYQDVVNYYGDLESPDDLIGPGLPYANIKEYQQAAQDYIDAQGIDYDLGGVDGVLGPKSKGFFKQYGRDFAEANLADKAAGLSDKGLKTEEDIMNMSDEEFAKAYPSHADPVGQTPAADGTTPTTDGSLDATLGRPFGSRRLEYTDGQWRMMPGGSRFRTTPAQAPGMGQKFNFNAVQNMNTAQGAPVGDRSVSYYAPNVPGGRVGEMVGDLQNRAAGMMQRARMDRSDRMAMRQQKLQERAAALEQMGNDRAAGRLRRRADMIGSKLPAQQQREQSREEMRDNRNSVRMSKAEERAWNKANRANEQAKLWDVKAQMIPQRIQSRGARKRYEQSAEGARDRSRFASNERRRRTIEEERMNRTIADEQTRDEDRQLKNQFREAKTQQNQAFQTQANFNKEVRKRAGDRKRNEGWMKWLQGNRGGFNDGRTWDEMVQNRQNRQLGGMVVSSFSPITGTPTTGGIKSPEQMYAKSQMMRNGGRMKYQLSGQSFANQYGSPGLTPTLTPEESGLPGFQMQEFDLTSGIGDNMRKTFNQQGTGLPYSGQTFYGKSDPSTTLNINQKNATNFAKSSGPSFASTYPKMLNTSPSTPTTTIPNTDVTGKGRRNPLGLTRGETTGLLSTAMPAFYNLGVAAFRKPHNFKEYQNPYDAQYLAQKASMRAPTDYNPIISQRNQLMRKAQSQAPNFQTAQAYQMAGQSGLDRTMAEQKRKDFLTNQQFASQYADAQKQVGEQRLAKTAQADERTRQAEAARRNLIDKAVTQLGVAGQDLSKLLVNREMTEAEWGMLGQIYNQYGLKPLQAVLNGEASWEDIVKFKGNPAAMAQLMSSTQSHINQNKAKKPTTTTENYSVPGASASVTTTN
jgi:hypothetical protein